ncbi:DUF4037 domain-containing protein [Streptomyces albidoflavus]|uniref:DUF4037 domain-containing protein n=1 Tax=Streptomyces albidoflavus TaxID=1886 RepID=UPI003414C094
MTHPAPDFLPGLELSRLLYEEAVRPLLDEVHPGLRYAAARVGTGSEVLGFDTPRSADHEWGPRLQLFLTPEDAARHTATLHELLRERLPKEVRGWPTHFRPATADGPIGHMTPTDGPVDHRVDLLETDRWLTGQLGPGATAEEPTAADWLAMPQQRLAEVTGGAVFHDGPGALTAARLRLAWYPDQVWRYLLACQWQRVSQEEAFVGRCSEAGDELGCAALAATTYPDRERHLGDAYRHLAARQNATGLTDPVDPALRPYHDRPYQVLHAERFTQALTATLTDPALRALPLTGSIDQQTDNTDVLTRPGAPAF